MTDAPTRAKWIRSLEEAIAQDPTMYARYCQTLALASISKEQEFSFRADKPSEFEFIVRQIAKNQRPLQNWRFSIVRAFEKVIHQGRRDYAFITWRGFVIAFDDHADSSAEEEEPWFSGVTFGDDLS